jgi:hypothetical protein
MEYAPAKGGSDLKLQTTILDVENGEPICLPESRTNHVPQTGVIKIPYTRYTVLTRMQNRVVGAPTQKNRSSPISPRGPR